MGKFWRGCFWIRNRPCQCSWRSGDRTHGRVEAGAVVPFASGRTGHDAAVVEAGDLGVGEADLGQDLVGVLAEARAGAGAVRANPVKAAGVPGVR